jgi:FMN phosphatase YigB (HAD superfamily)
MKATCLFLDIGGVLLSNGWDYAARARAAVKFELDAAAVEARHHLMAAAYEEGKVSLDDYLDRVIFAEKRPFSRDEFRRFMFEQSTADAAMIDLCCAIKARRRIKVAVVSNEGRELNAYRIEKFRLGRFVDFFVSSCFVGLRKPDASIYRLALDLAQAPASQVIYVENTPLFASVAEEIGIRSIVHRDEPTTRAALLEVGLSGDAAANAI